MPENIQIKTNGLYPSKGDKIMTRKRFGIAITVAGVVVVLALVFWAIWGTQGQAIGRLWIAGAAGIGFLSGFTTGVSNDTGSGKEFVKFIGTGVLIPILGSGGTLLIGIKEYTEKNVYLQDKLTEQTTRTVTTFSDGLLHPIAVLGSFFVGFALLAVVGIIAGALLRAENLMDVKLT